MFKPYFGGQIYRRGKQSCNVLPFCFFRYKSLALLDGKWRQPVPLALFSDCTYASNHMFGFRLRGNFRNKVKTTATSGDLRESFSVLACQDRVNPSLMGTVKKVLGDKASCLPAEARRILQKLASGWDDIIDLNGLQVIRLKGAMTNEVYQIKWPTNNERSRKVLVRIYGEGVDIFFDRENEIRTFEFLSKQGQGPRLLGRFSTGRVEEFIRARTLSASDLRDPGTSALIAAKMKEFHDLNMPGPRNVLLWNRLRNYLSTAKRMSSSSKEDPFRLAAMEEEITTLENRCSGDYLPVGFCHNDLQYGNIMMDEAAKSITIIDYEYACYNPVAFDIANHFCEMAADYHTDTPHVLDYSKYPGVEERRRFLHVYLSCSGVQPGDLIIEQCLQEAEKYTLASHLFWGLWGIISEHVNEIDFDYLEYARQRFQQYWIRKSELFGSSVTASNRVTDGDILKVE